MFRKSAKASPETPHDAAPARRFTDQDDEVSVIIRGVEIDGGIEGKGSLELGGTVRGDVRVEGLCRVREKGCVEGSIRAGQVLVEGEVEGRSITATGKLELRRHARVKADLEAATIAIADGSVLNGSVRTTGGGKPVTFEEKRAPDPD